MEDRNEFARRLPEAPRPEMVSWANKCAATIEKLKTENKEISDKLTAAMTEFLTQMLDKIKEDQQ